MRLPVAVQGALLLASSLLVHAVPNYEVSKTSIAVDKHREALDNGEIIVRVQRTDDLFSDPTAHEAAKLLLEKNTHIALRIQLNPNTGTVNVNDEPVDITSSEPKVTAVRAEALMLPKDHDLPVVDPDMMLSLLGQMSPGIVKVEVKVDSEPVSPRMPLSPPPPHPHHRPHHHHDEEAESGEEEKEEEASSAVSVRKVGLWIRITEIEGQELAHTTTTYAPILQLIVTTDRIDGVEDVVERVSRIQTLSINGQSPVDEALSAPGPMMLPHGARPPPGEGKGEKGRRPPHRGHGPEHDHRPEDGRGPEHGHGPEHEHGPEHRHRPEHGHRRPSGFFAWIARMLGYAPPHGRPHHGMHGPPGGKKPCPGGRKGRFPDGPADHEGLDEARTHMKDNKLDTHRPMLDNPFSGTVDDYEQLEQLEREDQGELEGEVDGEDREQLPGGRLGHHMRPRPDGPGFPHDGPGHHRDGPPHGFPHRPHHPHHHRHGRCGRFFRRFALGFVYGMALVGTFFMHPYTLLAVSGLAGSALLFHIVKRVAANRRGERIRLPESDEDDEIHEKEKEHLLESVHVERRTSEELPMYEARK